MEAAAAVSRRPAALTVARDYLTLTKPKVQSLLLFTTVTTMYVAGQPSLRLILLTCVGGALSAGKFAPPLHEPTDRQIYAAMLTGPQNMPVFGDNQLSPQEKQDIIAYVQNQKNDQDPGGWGIGRLGPVPEALVIFLVGLVALIFASLWIAGKS